MERRRVHEEVALTGLEAAPDLLVDVLGAAVPDRGALYVSTPITTGLRFVEWYLEEGRRFEPETEAYRRQHRQRVILPNLAEARRLVRDLRQENQLVLDPTSFEPPGWSQEEYRAFWGRVIERYASTLILMEGWEYSAGCCFEFLVAVCHSIAARDVDGHPVRATEGRKKIETAVALMRDRGVPADFNGTVAELLKAAVLAEPQV